MSIDRARGIQGWMEPNELTWLAEQAKTHYRIAEIGSWLGRSTAALSDHTPGTVVAVDTWAGSDEPAHHALLAGKDPDWLYREFLRNVGSNVEAVRMNSLEAAAVLAERRFDMIFIDGAHDVASVKADIEAWLPLLEPGGLLCGHDYFTTVKEAVDSVLVARMASGSIWRMEGVRRVYDDLLPTAILVPSLDRPQFLRRLVANIHEATPEEHFIAFCVSDDESKRILDELNEWYLDDSASEDRRYVTRMNKLVGFLDDAATVFFGSDDVVHHPGWLSRALAVMATGPSVVVVNDLHNMAGTQAVVRRDYLDRAVFDHPGLAFHPGYRHNFADNEMFFTASQRGEFAWAKDSIVEHLHPLFHSANSVPWDDTYRNAQKGWAEDERRWKERQALIAAAIPATSPAFSVR